MPPHPHPLDSSVIAFTSLFSSTPRPCPYSPPALQFPSPSQVPFLIPTPFPRPFPSLTPNHLLQIIPLSPITFSRPYFFSSFLSLLFSFSPFLSSLSLFLPLLHSNNLFQLKRTETVDETTLRRNTISFSLAFWCWHSAKTKMKREMNIRMLERDVHLFMHLDETIKNHPHC